MKHSNPLSRPTPLAAGLILLSFALLLAACAPYGVSAQGSNANTPAAPAGSATPMATAAASGNVQVAKNTKLGQILVTSSGFTLYTFALDKPGVSNCTDSACVKYWPPYTASAQPTVSAQLPGKLGLITRPDGAMQVAYNDLPLYTFLGDKKPGDATGDGLNENGGIWHAVVIGSASNTSAGGDIMGSGSTGGSVGGYTGGY